MDTDRWLIKLDTGEWDVISEGDLKCAMDRGTHIPLLSAKKTIELIEIDWAIPFNDLDNLLPKPKGMSKSNILAWRKSRKY